MRRARESWRRAHRRQTVSTRGSALNLETPFAPGVEASGKLTIRKYEHMTLTIWIEAMDAERFFSIPLASVRH